MLWFIAIIFLIITITLLSGKGSFLIAGYNTSSKAAKAKYDEKKLCKVMGSGMGILTVFIIILASFGDNPPNWMSRAFTIITIIVVIIMMILCNTICKATNIPATNETLNETKRDKLIKKGSLIFTVVVLLAVGVFLCTGQINVTLEANSIQIAGSYWSDYQVKLDSITNISYTETLNKGTRTKGLGSLKLLEGHFKNEEFGSYILYAYTKNNSYIILDTVDGTVVVNAETKEKTHALYKKMEGLINSPN